MSHLQIIEALCLLAEQQIGLIRELADALVQERALTEAERQAVGAASARYRKIIGDGEAGV